MIGSIAEYRRLLDAALAQGKVYIHLDARVAGVDLPEGLVGQKRVPLVLSRRYPQIELDLGDEAIAATLRFKGVPHRCRIPWVALLAILPTAPVPGFDLPSADGPAKQAEAPQLQVLEGDGTGEKKKERPRLRLVQDDEDEPPEDP
ncbi:MAG: hypothetical protein CMH55_04475 [Myxococcales bacterium]|nr:hypothetical protein [Myxococcales bacterium]|tara:strand:+ start:47 stop:484 length:438 start_codon:yes stop_codon:yes gene_type:complete